jgi:hypothetical protein
MRVQKVNITAQQPPVIKLISPMRVETNKRYYDVKFKIESETPVEEIKVLVNGAKLATKRQLSRVDRDIRSIRVPLEGKESIISIVARNRYSTSDPATVLVIRKSNEDTLFKPNLYILSIGVSDYKNGNITPLQFAHKDAKSIVDIFKRQEGIIYKKVVSKTLLNKDATKEELLDALSWIEKKTTHKDMAIIFIAGHGVNDSKSNYYFLNYDADIENLRRTALKWSEIKDTIEAIPSKIILMVDTCRSGNIFGDLRRRDVTSAISSIISTESGAVVLSASQGRGYSIESSKWGHGAFTKAIIEGLSEYRADLIKDGVISIKELDTYISERVNKLTKGEQKPKVIIPDGVPNFYIFSKER